MDRRIFGLENEYGVTCTFRGQRRLSPDEVARYLFRRVVHWGRSSNVFLENGARLYLDVGSHPEYATPECDVVREVVAHDKAGERILEGLLAAAEMRLHEEGINGQVYLFKNNTDSAGNSYGCHENYLVGATRGVRAHGRRADPVLRDPADLVRGRQGPARPPRRAVLHRAARRAHLGGRLERHDAQPPDHQHARRAARRRRALPAPPRDRRRLEHERMDHLHEGGDHRPRAPDGRGQHRDARSLPGEPDPRDPRDQPRHELHPDGEARERPGALGPRDADRVPGEDRALHRARGQGRDGDTPARRVAGGPRGAGRRRARASGPQGRLGHETTDDRPVHGEARPDARLARRSPCWISRTTT